MKNVIIRIAAIFAGAVLVTGCFGEIGPRPAPAASPIRFEAGTSPLLQDDDTRVTPLHPAYFEATDDFSVFSLYNNQEADPVFDGAVITYNGTAWNYANLSEAKDWAWNQNEDRYDFVAVSPASAGATRLVGAPGRLTVTADYDLTADGHDLMAAAYSRTGESGLVIRTAPVPMTFKHMLSAVRVDFHSISGEGNFTVNSYCFKNIVNRSTLKATLTSASKESFVWINSESSTAAVRQENPAAGAHNPVAPGDSLIGAGFNLVIPQRLDAGVNLPALEITYTPASTGVPVTPPLIPLEEILRFADDQPILEWNMGVAYVYKVFIRLDGGVEVRVVTTEWDEVVYETPGIMIPA